MNSRERLNQFVSLVGLRTAVAVAVVVAIGIYIGALKNSWAMDDIGIIAENEAAHSVAGGLQSFFKPYWPVEDHLAGQYRPLVILSYAVDWTVSNGNPFWSHAVNVVLHGIVTALVVVVVATWLSPLGACLTGLVFAVHPVHVEAVANVVGRAELFVAIAILASVLAARRFRHTNGPRRIWWAMLSLGFLLFGLLSKEHAVVGVLILALDETLDPVKNFRRNTPLYTAALVVTVSWFFLWKGIAGDFVTSSVNATLRDLNTADRLYTALPVQAEAMRLLAWPMSLAADYNPQIIPRRSAFSWPALIGLVNIGAILTLAGALWRKAPVVTFAIIVGVLTYAPTANIVFASGVILGERNLYLAAMAVGVAVAWIVERFQRSPHAVGLWIGVVGLLGVYSVRVFNRVPAWRSTGTIVATEYLNFPENYRTRVRYASYLQQTGRFQASFAELTAATAIFSGDPVVGLTSVQRALELGNVKIALREASSFYQEAPDLPGVAGPMVRALLANGMVDSAITVARRSMEFDPTNPVAARWYTEILRSVPAESWRGLVAVAHREWRSRRAIGASSALTAAAMDISEDTRRLPAGCWDANAGLELARAILPYYSDVFSDYGADCPSQSKLVAR